MELAVVSPLKRSRNGSDTIAAETPTCARCGAMPCAVSQYGHGKRTDGLRARQEITAPAWAGFTRVYWSADACGRAALQGRAGAPAPASHHASGARGDPARRERRRTRLQPSRLHRRHLPAASAAGQPSVAAELPRAFLGSASHPPRVGWLAPTGASSAGPSRSK